MSGLAVRPTSDRLRERLFNILAARIEGSRFLDICAGSGAVGIEALSRGAREVTFIERSRRACEAIRQNLDSLEANHTETIARDAVSALKYLANKVRQFDIAYLDPPYESEVYGAVMNFLGSSDLLSSDAVVVVEHRVKNPPETRYGKLRLVRAVKQGESSLAFYGLGESGQLATARFPC